MTGPSLDLDALREKAERAIVLRYDDSPESVRMAISARDLRAVLALVDEQRKEIERLRGAVKWARQEFLYLEARGWPEALDDIVAGSPAENKEPTDA